MGISRRWYKVVESDKSSIKFDKKWWKVVKLGKNAFSAR